jgi:chemotaxis signal transduction protein
MCPPPSPGAHAPNYVRGVITLRGTVIPVLDMAVKMGNQASEKTNESRIVVAEFEEILFGSWWTRSGRSAPSTRPRWSRA